MSFISITVFIGETVLELLSKEMACDLSKLTDVDMVKYPINPSGSGSWGCWWEVFRLSIPSRSVSVPVVLLIENRLFILVVPLCILVLISSEVFFFFYFVVLIFSNGEGACEDYGKETSFPDNVYGNWLPMGY